MAKKKIPGKIRFLPELDCISLEGVKQHFGSLCEDINFLYTIGQRFFSGWMRGARKSILVWELHKENGAGEGQVHSWSPLLFLLAHFRIFVFLEIIFVSDCSHKMEQEHFGDGLLPI